MLSRRLHPGPLGVKWLPCPGRGACGHFRRGSRYWVMPRTALGCVPWVTAQHKAKVNSHSLRRPRDPTANPILYGADNILNTSSLHLAQCWQGDAQPLSGQIHPLAHLTRPAMSSQTTYGKFHMPPRSPRPSVESPAPNALGLRPCPNSSGA